MYHGGIINGVAQGGKIVLRRVYNTLHRAEGLYDKVRYKLNRYSPRRDCTGMGISSITSSMICTEQQSRYSGGARVCPLNEKLS